MKKTTIPKFPSILLFNLETSITQGSKGAKFFKYKGTLLYQIYSAEKYPKRGLYNSKIAFANSKKNGNFISEKTRSPKRKTVKKIPKRNLQVLKTLFPTRIFFESEEIFYRRKIVSKVA